ncbi:MAG: DUF6591 domain-containing protein [Ruminiclostridium sp.]
MKTKKITVILCLWVVLLAFSGCKANKNISTESAEKITQSSSITAAVENSVSSNERTETDETNITESETYKSTDKIKEETTETSEITETAAKPETIEPAETTAAATDNEIRPEFKESIDSYEAFFDEYCRFMKKYSENPNDLSLLNDYTNFLKQYAETMEKLEALDSQEMNDAERKYYTEAMLRINQKLIEAAA